MKNRLRNKLRVWLDIKDPIDVIPLLEDQKKSTKVALDEFEKILKSFCEIECVVCHKKIVTYPFGGGYYREADGSVMCSTKCLDKRIDK